MNKELRNDLEYTLKNAFYRAILDNNVFMAKFAVKQLKSIRAY